jgi:hypothetical protein
MHGEPGTAAREYGYEIEAGYRAGRVQALSKGDSWRPSIGFPGHVHQQGPGRAWTASYARFGLR